MPRKSQNIVREKKDFMTFLKFVTNYISSDNRVKDTSALNNMLGSFKPDKGIYKRLVSYLYGHPHTIWFLNKYTNHLWDFNKYTIDELIKTVAYICYMRDIRSKNFMYLKGSAMKDVNREQIKKLLKEYAEVVLRTHVNDKELNFYYDLVKIGHVTPKEFEQVDRLLNNDKVTLKLEDILLNLVEDEKDTYKYHPDKLPPISEDIQRYCLNVKTAIKVRAECSNCPLFGKPTVVLDSNAKTPGPVDICFVGLNPGKDEVPRDRPFVGMAGSLLREKIHYLPENIIYMITNAMLCHTNSEKDIPNPELCIRNCQGLLLQNITSFKPRIIVPMGLKVCQFAFGLKGTMGQLHGKLITTHQIPVLPLFHPSYVKQYNKHREFNQGWNQLLKFLGAEPQNVPKVISAGQPKQYQSKTPQFNIPPDKMITEVTPDLTFFDVREVSGGTIVKIFIDPHGVKKYLIEDNRMKFYINHGDWNDNSMINSNFETTVEVNGWDKRDVMGVIREQFNQTIGNRE